MTNKSPAASLSDKPLKDLTVAALRDLCRERDIKGFAHKTKAKLLEMLEAPLETSGQSGADPASQPKSGQPEPKQTSKAETAPGNGQQKDLTSLTIAQLKQFCRDQNIKGFARKNKQQLLGLINAAISPESPNGQPGIDEREIEEKIQDPGHPEMEGSPMDEPDSDPLHSEDLDANLVGQEDSAGEPSRAELDLDAAKENFEGQFNGDAEETMVEVSDSLIFEVLDRFDRIEALLQRIAENVDNA